MNWDEFQRLTVDSLHIYEALRRAERLSEEGERLLKEAEDLLRRAALAYLLEPLPAELRPDFGASSAVGVAEAWVEIQQVWADLKYALYQLAKTRLESKDLSVLIALVEMDQSYRDAAPLLKKQSLSIAEECFGKGEWNDGREVMRRVLKTYPDKEIRLELLRSFVTQVIKSLSWEESQIGDLCLSSVHLHYDKTPLESLLCEEPAVAELKSWQCAISFSPPFYTRTYLPSYVSQSDYRYAEEEELKKASSEYRKLVGFLNELLLELTKLLAI